MQLLQPIAEMPNTVETILLDLDGVIADWVGAACNIFGADREELEANWGDDWELSSALGITKAKMWHEIDAAGIEFWSQLKPYPWKNDLFALCRRHAQTFILTSPSQSHFSPAGKVLWMNEHLADGDSFRNFLMGPRKELCARPTSLLIDDRDSNCQRFRRAGGKALVFPRVWNSNRAYAEDPLTFVKTVLPELVR